MSYPDVFLYCWINMGDQILNPNFLEQGLQKDLGKIGKCILTQSRYSSSTNFSNRISNHNRALQFHSHTQYIYVPICQKKYLVTTLYTVRCYTSKFIYIANRARICKMRMKFVFYLLFNITLEGALNKFHYILKIS